MNFSYKILPLLYCGLSFEGNAKTISTNEGNELLYLSLEELVQIEVTGARSGKANLREVPIAITTISSTEFERTVARDIRDMAHNTPGLVISQNIDYAQIYIRGVGSNNIFAGADPSSTIHLDGV